LNRSHDASRVASNAVNHRRRHRVQELEPDEVQAGLTLDKAALVLKLALLIENRQIDPIESGMETARPDHICDVHDPAIL
jgi:hypothetical protein